MYDLHEYLANELCNNKSLGALTYLLEKGREFEFSYKGTLCFISRSETQKEVSIWIDKKEHAFDNIDDLKNNFDEAVDDAKPKKNKKPVESTGSGGGGGGFRHDSAGFSGIDHRHVALLCGAVVYPLRGL